MKDDELTISIYKPEYGQGIADCLRAVYGEGYAIKSVYDPAALHKEFELGDRYYAVALNRNGTVVGCEAMYRSAPFKSIYEIGAGVVIPEYRGRGIQYILYDLLADYLKTYTSMEEIVGEPVCNHVKMQRMMCDKGGIEGALEVDLVPAETFRKESGGAEIRVSTVLSFICVKERPHEVFVPEPYVEEFKMLYGGLQRERRFSPGGFELPSGVVTQGEVVIFRYADVARLTVRAFGNDFDKYMNDHDGSMEEQHIEVSQVFLPLDRPGISKAVKILRSRGYFLGGILPRWFDSDGMLMQRLSRKPDWSGITIYSSRGKQIFEMVRADWEGVLSARP